VVVWWQWGGDESGEMKVGLGVDVVEVDVGEEAVVAVEGLTSAATSAGGGGGRDGDGVRLC
ncbi:hypothetical protein Tco_0057031, partial [Tanacetum coccineum]